MWDGWALVPGLGSIAYFALYALITLYKWDKYTDLGQRVKTADPWYWRFCTCLTLSFWHLVWLLALQWGFPVALSLCFLQSFVMFFHSGVFGLHLRSLCKELGVCLYLCFWYTKPPTAARRALMHFVLTDINPIMACKTNFLHLLECYATIQARIEILTGQIKTQAK